jgi:hypothetical protein
VVAGNREGVNRIGGTVTATNTIFWGNTGGNTVGTFARFDYCRIDNPYDGTNCVSAIPLFYDNTYFHLKSRQGTYAGGYFSGGTFVPADDNSPLIDRGHPDLAWGLEPFPNGRRINMGAYANTETASMTHITATILMIR